MKSSTFKEAITPAKLNNGEATSYGFGWFVSKDGKVVSHTGGWVGFRNILVRYLEGNRTLVFLSNGTEGRAGRLLKNILDGKSWALPQTEVITDVNIIDGSGLPSFKADVRIVDNRIQEVGKLPIAPGELYTDGDGLTLAPGFIDSHSHHDWGLSDNPSCVAATNQGVTTIVVGQDGGSTPVSRLAAQLKTQAVSVNLASFTGHSSLRSRAMKGDVLRKAKPDEIDVMKKMLEEELKNGSLGLSSGLEYEPAFYSNTAEVIELAKVAAKYQGIYISHIRSEDVYQNEAIGEIIDIGREAKLPVQITHIKIAQRSRWGSSASLLQQLQRARQQGVDISADVYPYTMWSSTPRVLFPKKDFTSLASAQFATQELFDPATSVMVNFPANRTFEGKTITEIGQMNNESEAEALLRIIRVGAEKEESGSIVATSMSEEDISNFLRWEHTSICSDGAMSGHPRGHGAFTRVLGRYVREKGVLSLPSAIHKMTALPAEKLGIRNRGLITPGYFADLVLFKPETVMDNASIQSPTARSTGIEKVWVNGQVV
ncbi:MAG: amidohydrolase family protein [Saprospiraceae bacterium]|nr:amidohydrolase family protein [Saprospiraceae bacterium]